LGFDPRICLGSSEVRLDKSRRNARRAQLTPTGFGHAINYFQEATKKNPKYALAYTGLADCYAMLPMIGDSPSRKSFPGAHLRYAHLLLNVGRHKEALAEAEHGC
jgi:tetratricopeptide (TPR) repeat protein